MIDIDEQPHTNQMYGVRTRLRDDACDRELERPDAKRRRYLAVDAMLKADERKVLDAGVCGAVVAVLLVHYRLIVLCCLYTPWTVPAFPHASVCTAQSRLARHPRRAPC